MSEGWILVGAIVLFVAADWVYDVYREIIEFGTDSEDPE